jgi:hypothetical protein
MKTRPKHILGNGLFTVAVVALACHAGCSKSPSIVIQSNTVVVRSATSNEVVLSVQAKAGSRVWIEHHAEQAGLCSIPQEDVNATVTYRIEKEGYSIAGLARTHNTMATDVAFHETPLVTNNVVEIGTYSQWGHTGNRIVFKVE